MSQGFSKGIMGATGVQGETGVQGVQGDTGVQGVTGVTYPPTDVLENDFVMASNVTAPANINGFAFSPAVRAFEALVSVRVNAHLALAENIKISGVRGNVGWLLSTTNLGDDSGVDIIIDGSGQMLYTSANYPGFQSGVISYRASTTNDLYTPLPGFYHIPETSYVNMFVANSENTDFAAWGANAEGELGDGTILDSSTPVSVNHGVVYRVLSADDHTLAISSLNDLYAWGNNTRGQLGQNDTVNTSSPVRVSMPSRVMDIAAGYNSSTVLTEDGLLRSFGFGSGGQLGVGDTISYSSPVVLSVTSIVAVTRGNYNGFALDAGGTVWSWGDNSNGALGQGSATNTSSPASVLTDKTFVKLAKGASRGRLMACLDEGGYAWAWGRNIEGGLGVNDVADRSTPVSVLGGPWATISRGFSSMVALDIDGYAWAWGSNGFGQIGDNSIADVSSPVSVLGDRRYKSIIMTRYTTFGVDLDDNVWAWGRNISGLLGAPGGDRSTPVSVNRIW